MLGTPRRLCGFTKVELKSGETKHVILALDKRSFSIYDTAALRWMSPEGTYEVMVGTSSRDLPLHSSVTVNATGGP
jgi:beta-glucosidase